MPLQETLTFENLVHEWGCSISEAVLDSSCNYFHIPEIEGFIGYRIAYGCAVVLGDPICPENQKATLAEAFQAYCQENHMTTMYFIASEKFSTWAINHVSKILIEVGEEIVFDPFIDPTLGHKGAKLRNTIHHAQHLGLTVKEYTSQDLNLEKKILEVGEIWLKARKGPQIYLGHLNFFDNKNNRRWFYLQDASQKIIGMALLSRLNAYEGWLLKFLIVIPDAPRGASELLMTSILDTLRQENCHFITYGMVPIDHLGKIVGLGIFSKQIAKISFQMAKWIFHLNQRKIYWQKFHPQSEKSYLLFSSPTIGTNELRALAHTMKVDF